MTTPAFAKRPSSQSPSSPASSTSSGDEALEVRQRAFDLLNRMGPGDDDDEQNWPRSPRISSYQHVDHHAAAREASYHVEDEDNNAEVWGGSAVQGFVQCVSDACKLGASGIVSQNASFARSGYQALKSVIVAETQDRFPSTVERPRGSFESVPVMSYQRGSR